jgi:hypothetical protein
VPDISPEQTLPAILGTDNSGSGSGIPDIPKFTKKTANYTNINSNLFMISSIIYIEFQ